MIERELATFFQDILKMISAIERFMAGMNFEDFKQDERTIFSVKRALEIIGETVKNVPQSLRIKYPDIPWKSIAGMRDKLIHEYWKTDVEVVWATTQRYVPKLKVLIARVIEELQVDE